MVSSKTVGLRRTQPFEFPKAQQRLGLHGRPAGKFLRPAGLRATFLYEPRGFVFVLKNFFGCDWATLPGASIALLLLLEQNYSNFCFSNFYVGNFCSQACCTRRLSQDYRTSI